MPYIRDYVVTEFPVTSTAAGTGEMPNHESGDMLIVIAVKDGTGAITRVGTDYTVLSAQASAGSWGGSWYRRAASNSEPAFSATWTADSSVFVIIAVANPHGTNNPSVAVRSADVSTIPFDQTATLATPSANCLAIYACLTDAVQGPTPWAHDMQTIHAGDSGEAGIGIGWMFYPASSSATNGVRFFGNTADDTRVHTIVIEDDGNNSIIPAYVDKTSTAPNVLSTVGGAGLTFDGRAWSIPTSVIRPWLGRDFTQCWDYTGSGYNDETVDMNDVGTADVTFTNTTSGIFYWGFSAKFSQMVCVVSTAGTGSPTSVWEYSIGSSSWSPLTLITGEVNFITAGARVFRWAIPSTWVADSVNSVSAFYIRRRQTANWTIAAVLSGGAVNGMGNLYDAVAATADSGVNPYHTSNALTGPSTVPDLNNMVGNEFLSGTAIDMNPGYFLTTFRFVAPRDLIDMGTYGKYKGATISAFDTSNNYKSWVIAAKDGKDTSPDGRMVVGIQPAQSQDTTWAAQGSFDANIINRLYFATANAVAGVAAQFSMLMFVNGIAIVSGGTTGTKLTFSDICNALIKGCSTFPIVSQTGSSAVFYVPMQFGGGDNVKFNVSLATFQFPKQASESEKTGLWHVDSNLLNWAFYGKTSADYMHFRSCVFVTETTQNWTIHASASASADWDFTGTVVVNHNVSLQNIMTFDSMSFINCPTFTQNAAPIENSIFENTKISSSSPANAAKIKYCEFTSGGSGHAIEIGGAAADFALEGCTFIGYSGTGTDAAIYVNIGAGTVNISITGDGDTPSIRTQGATVNVINARTVKVTAVDADTSSPITGARVLLYASTGSSVTITSSGGTATVTHASHGYLTGQKVAILGANEGDYNGIKTITVTGGGEYTYAISGSPSSPATGTILSHRVILDGDTNGSGIVQDTAFPFVSELAVTGRVRKGSASTYYKSAPLSGSITSAAGFDSTVFMVKDE